MQSPVSAPPPLLRRKSLTIQRWWRGLRLSRILTLDEDLHHSSPFPKSWFLKNEDIPADLQFYLKWHPTWEKRLGRWRFHPPKNIFRTKSEKDYLIASLVWADGVGNLPTNEHAEILYDPIERLFSVQGRTFSSFTEVLLQVEHKSL